MAERAKHDSRKDQGSFRKGDKEAPRARGKPATVKDTAKTREAKRSKGGRRERETRG
jgi:hypothetical protein